MKYLARDEESFSKIRIEALSQLQRIINDKIHLNANNTNAITDVVIVDDLMHLHSMRRDVYKLTRDLQVPQVVVHVKTDLTTALERNALRNATERIPDEVVTRLYHQMEEPNTAAIADRHNCTINGQSFERCGQTLSYLCNL
jgi:tRNA uridine 5-carbamoylmethylation protein Kti12